MKNMKLVLESWKKFESVIKEDALGSDKPVPLSTLAANPELAKAAHTTGKQDNAPTDDVVQVQEGAPVAVSKLNPMQKEVLVWKALAFAFGYLKSGSPDLSDMSSMAVEEPNGTKYIMDGHHRWAAATLLNPLAEVKVSLVTGVTASDLITALNIDTAARGEPGKPAKGDITTFAKNVPAELDKVIAEGTAGEYPIPAEEIKPLLGKVPGANGDPEKGKQLMIANAAKLPATPHKDAPTRVDMPQLPTPEIIKSAIEKLKAGQIDFKAPHSAQTQAAMKGAKAPAAAAPEKPAVTAETIRRIVKKAIQEELSRVPVQRNKARRK